MCLIGKQMHTYCNKLAAFVVILKEDSYSIWFLICTLQRNQNLTKARVSKYEHIRPELWLCFNRHLMHWLELSFFFSWWRGERPVGGRGVGEGTHSQPPFTTRSRVEGGAPATAKAEDGWQFIFSHEQGKHNFVYVWIL